MSEQKFPRRTLLKGALLGVATVPVAALLGRTANAAGGRVDPNEPQANPNFKPGQHCWSCLQAPTGKEGMAEVACNIFAGRPVSGKGWCKVFVKRP
jgi:hypothetical protein